MAGPGHLGLPAANSYMLLDQLTVYYTYHIQISEGQGAESVWRLRVMQ